jgi:diguanylate cyclase (GGDEF)-like protein
MRILIVEDDEFVGQLLAAILEHQDYGIDIATDGQAGWELAQTVTYDLILLDVMLPKLDGIDFCRNLRNQGYRVPILLLSGRDSSEDREQGLNAGADDYVVKPFEVEDLLARIRTLLHRDALTTSILHWSDLQLDSSSCQVTYNRLPVNLTAKEYSLLELLLRSPHHVFSCSAITLHLWWIEETPGEEVVRTHIKSLQQKLTALGAAADLIDTVYGIGYRLKPQESHLSENRASIPSTGIWEHFKSKMIAQVEALVTTAELFQVPLDETMRASIEREAHMLAGALGLFGANQASAIAKEIERLLRDRQNLHGQITKVSELAAALRTEVQQSGNTVSLVPQANDRDPLLLIIDRDRSLAEKIVTEANNQGIWAEIATNLSTARDMMAWNSPSLVLLDLSVNSTTENSWTFLTDLREQKPTVPVLVFTDQDSLSDRHEVALLGARAFLQKPVTPVQVLEVINQVLQQSEMNAEANIMVVDDDPLILVTMRRLLEPWGLKVTTLEDPRRFWEVLETSSPDLLVLDIHMPHLSGLELCQIVRNDTRNCGLPILFLTASSDPQLVQQVFAVGGDDFVSKPIVGPEVVTRIVNRLERIQLLRNLAETDPLTKVSNRYKSTQDLDKFLRLSQRHQKTLCLAILDLDHFKQVNDRYGHDTGDLVLRQMGQLLKRSFRREDVVARWGGEEFVIGMYSTSAVDGMQRLTKFQAAVRQEDFMTVDKQSLPITFSAGIAVYPEDGTDLQSLYRAADQALSVAKIAGRNRIYTVKAAHK